LASAIEIHTFLCENFDKQADRLKDGPTDRASSAQLRMWTHNKNGRELAISNFNIYLKFNQHQHLRVFDANFLPKIL